MKLTLVAILAVISTVAVQARPFHRPIIRPQAREICVFNLEKEVRTRFGSEYIFEEAFTEFGPSACYMAENACERVRDRQWDYWNYRCEQDFNAGGGPGRGNRICEYRIETRFGFEPEVYSSRGRFACDNALQECKDDLKYKRSLQRWQDGWVGPAAECVQTSSNGPGPRPVPRLVTASCSVDLVAGRVGRPTGNVFSSSASATNYQEALQRACDSALSACRTQARGTMRCEVSN